MRPHFNSKLAKGFTIIEMLVAITILLIGVLGPLSMMVAGIVDGLFAQNQIIANYLAQEALEAVISVKKQQQATFFSSYSNFCTTGGSTDCLVAVDSQGGVALTAYGGGGECAIPGQASWTDCAVAYNSSTDIYQAVDSNSQGVIFYRKVNIDPINIGTDAGGTTISALKVTVSMAWFNRAVERNMAISTYLYPDF